jgi:hypothetical protein
VGHELLTPSFIFAMKSRGLPEPAAVSLTVGAGAAFAGPPNIPSCSRKKYRAASTTPKVRMTTSEEDAMVVEGERDEEEGEVKMEGESKSAAYIWRRDE